MQIEPFVAQVATQLQAAAALGDERTQQIATGLMSAAEAGVRLAVLGAVTAAAEEITAALLDAEVAGSPTVTVGVDGDELRVHVTVAPAVHASDASPGDESDATARISLRLPENLKAQIDDAAAQQSISVNTWLVRAATAALHGSSYRSPGASAGFRMGGGGHRITGWVTG